MTPISAAMAASVHCGESSPHLQRSFRRTNQEFVVPGRGDEEIKVLGLVATRVRTSQHDESKAEQRFNRWDHQPSLVLYEAPGDRARPYPVTVSLRGACYEKFGSPDAEICRFRCAGIYLVQHLLRWA